MIDAALAFQQGGVEQVAQQRESEAIRLTTASIHACLQQPSRHKARDWCARVGEMHVICCVESYERIGKEGLAEHCRPLKREPFGREQRVQAGLKQAIQRWRNSQPVESARLERPALLAQAHDHPLVEQHTHKRLEVEWVPTCATDEKKGLFEIADGGTLFLDEIMEMPMPLQSKLLRALETRSFFRVGGVKKVSVNVRLLAATNRDKGDAIADGSFRADLMYRINSFEINIAPLRERREDIEPLSRYLLGKLAGPNAPRLSDAAVDALHSFDWSGNVRQLRNCLERAVLLADNGIITPRELPPEIAFRDSRPAVSVSYQPPRTNGASTFQNAVPTNLRDVERQQIIGALEKTGWHRGKTAELLGISPSTLYRRLREYGLESR